MQPLCGRSHGFEVSVGAMVIVDARRNLSLFDAEAKRGEANLDAVALCQRSLIGNTFAVDEHGVEFAAVEQRERPVVLVVDKDGMLQAGDGAVAEVELNFAFDAAPDLIGA